jgi:PKD repeat protein
LKKGFLLVLVAFMGSCFLQGQSITVYLPHHQAVTADHNMRFTWQHRPDVTQYTLELSADSLFGSVQTYVTSNDTLVLNGLTLGFHWWRAKAGNGNWSVPRRFFVFNPKQISGLSYWVRADSNVNVINGKVSLIYDLSDSARTTTQQAFYLMPDFIQYGVGNLSSIHFGKNGLSGQSTRMDFNPLHFPQGATMFSIWNVTGNPILLQYLFTGLINNSYKGGFFIGGTYPSTFNSGCEFNTGNYFSANGPIHLFPTQTTVSKNSVWRNGVNLPTTPTGASNGISLSVNILGGRADVNMTHLFTYADISEILLYAGDVPDSSRILIERYLMSKYARPVTLPYDTLACAPSLTLTVPGGTEEFSSLLWSTGAQGASINITANGTYHVTGISRIGGYTTTDTIRVNGILPRPQITPSTTQYFCFTQDSVLFQCTNQQVGLTYQWHNGATQPSIYVSQGNDIYITAYDSLSGCSITSDTTHLQHQIEAGMIFTEVCEGNPTSFTDNSQVYNQFIQSWHWDFGDPLSTTDSSNNPISTYTYAQAGNYYVSLIVTDVSGCTDTLFHPVTVKALPNANFSYNAACLGSPVQFVNQSNATPPLSIAGYKWYYGNAGNDSSTVVNPSFTYNSIGNYPVTLVVTADNGCKDTITNTVLIDKSINAAFIMPNDTLCLNETHLFEDTSQVLNTQYGTSLWKIGNALAGNQTTQSIVFNQSGLQTVTLIVTSSDQCTDSLKKNIQVLSPPSSQFSVTPNVGYPPLITQYAYTGNTSGITWEWTLPSGAVDTASTIIPDTLYINGTDTVQLITVNTFGCSDTTLRFVSSVFPNLNLYLDSLMCWEQDSQVQFFVHITNVGNIPVDSFQLQSWISGNSPSIEAFNDTLFVSQTFSYASDFTMQVPPVEGELCCVRVGYVRGLLGDTLLNRTLCIPRVDHAFMVMSPFPNPVDASASIQVLLPYADVFTLVMSDMQGKIISEKTINGTVGVNPVSYDVSALSAGVYFLTVHYRSEKKVVRMIVY